jgi:hypothetical protein
MNHATYNRFAKIFGVPPMRRKRDLGYATPQMLRSRKNTDDTPSDFSEPVDDQDGRKNPDADADDQDDGTFHAGDGGDSGDGEQQRRNKNMNRSEQLSAIN